MEAKVKRSKEKHPLLLASHQHLASFFIYSSSSLIVFLLSLLVSSTNTMLEEDRKPAFYKIIHSNLNTTTYLRIPTDFMNHLEKEESRAVLEDASGNHWYVEVFRSAEDTILQNGWGKFLKDHSLGNYEFLVFNYAGGMCFKVQIFDKTGCEQPNRFQEAAISSGGRKQDKIHRKGFEHYPRKQGRPLKKLFIPALRRRGRPPIYSGFSHQFLAKTCTKGAAMESPQETNNQLWPRKRQSTEEQKAWEAAMLNPNAPYFVKCLTKFEMKSSSYYMRIPTTVKSHLPKWKTEVVLTNHRGKRTWKVNYVPGTGFCGGWRVFLRENKLKRGDICLFEFMSTLKLCVHINPISKQR